MQVKINVISLEGLSGDLVTPKEFKFDFIKHRTAIAKYVKEEAISQDTLSTKLPQILQVSDIGTSDVNLASVSWLKEVVIVEIPDNSTVAFGYIQDGKIRICNVMIGSKLYYVSPAHATYREIFAAEDPYIGYRLDNNALFSALDAFPYLDNYNIIDPRFCLTTEHMITLNSNNYAANYLTGLLVSLSNFRNDSSKPWYRNCFIDPIPLAHVYIIDALVSEGVPNWSRFGDDVEAIMTETDRIEHSVLRTCLGGFRSPLVTYDYDLWYHNLSELNALGEYLMK